MANRVPILRAIVSTGDTYDDPSEDVLFMLFEDVQREDAEFFVVERLSDTSGQTYAQTIPEPDGGWTVERREGSADAHFSTRLPDMRSAHALMTQWAFELPGVNEANWERIDFE